MKRTFVKAIATTGWMAGSTLGLLTGCDRLGLGTPAGPDGAPDEAALQAIGYMTTAPTGANGRKVYTQLDQAKSCADLELAMRWNRPPNAVGGSFGKKMIYLDNGIPKDLPKQSEVFVRGTIERGEALASGSSGWILKLPDGGEAQAIEEPNFWDKQQQAAQDAGPKGQAAVVKPDTPGRAFCAQAVYQGVGGKSPDGGQAIPLLSVLYAMDRDK